MTEVGNSAFELIRQRLFGIAFRMLGSRAEAEDVVQEAYIRWHHPDGSHEMFVAKKPTTCRDPR
jgi:RNA polymerase sigma-70 factor (ECF subfamily)